MSPQVLLRRYQKVCSGTPDAWERLYNYHQAIDMAHTHLLSITMSSVFNRRRILAVLALALFGCIMLFTAGSHTASAQPVGNCFQYEVEINVDPLLLPITVKAYLQDPVLGTSWTETHAYGSNGSSTHGQPRRTSVVQADITLGNGHFGSFDVWTNPTTVCSGTSNKCIKVEFLTTTGGCGKIKITSVTCPTGTPCCPIPFACP